MDFVTLNAGLQGIELQELSEMNVAGLIHDGFQVEDNFVYGTHWSMHPIDDAQNCDKNDNAQTTADVDNVRKQILLFHQNI